MAILVALGGILFHLGDPPALPRELEEEGARFSIWARGEYWYAEPNGQLVVTRGSRPGSGSLVRLGEDVDLEPRGVPGAELGASLGDHRLRLDYLHLSFEGREDLDQTVIFHGQTYSAGDHVHARVDLPRLSLNYDYDVWDTPWTRLQVGIIGHLYWVSARLSSATLDEKREYSRGTVAAAASVEVPLGPLRAGLDGSLGYSDSDHDFFGGIRFLVTARLPGPLEVGVGYRWERMDASAETNRVALTIHGPLVELGVRF
jgi:hypothetical protein